MTRRTDAEPETFEPEPSEPATAPPDPETAPLLGDAVAADTEMPETLISKPAAFDPEPPVAALPQVRRSGVLGPLLGGALAAVGGFALAHFNVFGLVAEDRSADLAAALAQSDAAEAQALAGIKDEVGALAGRVSTLEAVPVSEAPDTARLDDLDRRLAAIEAMPSDGAASTAALTAKLSQLERQIAAQPVTGSDPGLKAELDAALARLAEAEAAAADRAAKAEAAEAMSVRDAALRALQEAVAGGKPFEAELTALDDAELSGVLGPMAETGVPTLATLQAEFPDAARTALQTARNISTDDGWSARLVDFLAVQTGARSLTPQEGDTAGAILSRAEFALSEGRVEDSLTELRGLDPAVQVPFEAWVAKANAFLVADTALSATRGE
jgi:hypothetical protein